MQIRSIVPHPIYLVITDDEEFPHYRRLGPGYWETRVDQAWIPAVSTDALEAAFFEALRLTGGTA